LRVGILAAFALMWPAFVGSEAISSSFGTSTAPGVPLTPRHWPTVPTISIWMRIQSCRAI
jgi:hypothetical protein